MELQIPTALQTALYAGSVAVTVLAVAAVVLLVKLRVRLEAVAQAVEELKTEVIPLTQETRVLVASLRDLSERAREKWTEVEGIIDTARRWSQRANLLVAGVGSVVEPPILAANRRILILMKGLETFFRALSHRA
jgi:uncharacterized protein YoxC